MSPACVLTAVSLFHTGSPNAREVNLTRDADLEFCRTPEIYFRVAKEKAVNRECTRTGTSTGFTKCLWRLSNNHSDNRHQTAEPPCRRACGPRGRWGPTSTGNLKRQRADRSRVPWRGWKRTRLNMSRVRWLSPNCSRWSGLRRHVRLR